MTLPSKIVIATDFSPCAVRAGDVGLAWARRFGAELHWVHGAEHLAEDVTPSGLPLMTRYVEDGRKAARKKLEADVARAREAGVESEGHLVDAPAHVGIVALAREIEADLLVTGSQGHTGLQRLWLGSVAERILQHAPCPAMIVRDAGAPEEPKSILLGDDLTLFSSRARAQAVELARAFDARIDVLHSIDLGIPYLASIEVVVPQDVIGPASAAAVDQLDTEARDAPDVRFDNRVVHQRATTALCDTAEERGNDLIVVGTRSRSGFDRVLLGSVAHWVGRHAACSVLVVQPEPKE